MPHRPELFAWLFGAAVALAAAGCKEPYRVGEHVLVEWEEGKLYPGYITEQTGKSRFRIHFDGYDSRWDEDVSIDRIKGRVEGPVPAPPPPEKVARALGVKKSADAQANPALAVSPYKVGDRVRVTWRGSVYTAIILEVVSKDRFKVHYEGHESAWDEVVPLDRVVGRRK